MQDRPPTLEALTEEARDVTLQVHNAQERTDDRDYIAGALLAVEELGRHYRALYDSLSPGEQLKVDRALGRRVQDIKRMASLLPRVANVVTGSTPDRQVEGVSQVGERRITGVSWTQTRAPRGDVLSVGGEIEAWCGKCGASTTHHIFALVGNEPKQVICQVCNSRHTYRTTPARKRGEAEGTPAVGGGASGGRPGGGKTAANAASLLQQELASATTVRPFDPKDRYRVGEIIDHPELGRGKVENVLRSSLLVRFGRAGLRPVTLY